MDLFVRCLNHRKNVPDRYSPTPVWTIIGLVIFPGLPRLLELDARMRTYLYQPACFVFLLALCLMFAPMRLVTGDRTIHSLPSDLHAVVAPSVASDKPFADLCRDDPIGALNVSLKRCQRDVERYTCTFIKQERMNGKLRDREVIHCDFRESPFAVRMEWLEGAGRAKIMLYPAGDREDQLYIVPSNKLARAALPYVARNISDSSVRAASRYPANEFGIQNGVRRLIQDWRLAKDQGMLRTRYEGIQTIPELGNRSCHVLHRDCIIPEHDGMTAVTVYFDAETLFQAGAILKTGDELLATYYFNDFVLNPRFDADLFTAERLK